MLFQWLPKDNRRLLLILKAQPCKLRIVCGSSWWVCLPQMVKQVEECGGEAEAVVAWTVGAAT